MKDEEKWTAKTLNDGKDIYPVVKIEHGLKILCKEDLMNNLLSNNELKKEFQLNIKRKNRWYWSIYFKKI